MPQTAEATLDTSDVDDLFRDLAACADIQHIAIRHTSGSHSATPAPRDLAHARILLQEPDALAVQVRYTYNGDLWIDTLTRQDGGFALLRVQHAQSR